MNIESDLEKLHDILVKACQHHIARDEMNAMLHLADNVRFSPLTSELISARDRVDAILREMREG